MINSIKKIHLWTFQTLNLLINKIVIYIIIISIFQYNFSFIFTRIKILLIQKFDFFTIYI